MGERVVWELIPNDKTKWALVARLKGKPEIDAGSSQHVSEVHLVDDDGTTYRIFRAISDMSPIAIDDEIERRITPR